MRLLAIETTGSVGGFAVVEGRGAGTSEVIAELERDIMGRHVETSVDLVGEILELASLGLADLDGVAVSLGPGSFTGLRVGLGIAKGLSVGTGLPLAGVPTLDCIARPFRDTQGLVVPVRDARRGEVYCCVYRSGDGGIEKMTDYLSLAPQDAVALIEDRARAAEAKRPPEGAPSGTHVTLAGDGLARYGEVFRGLPGRVDFAGESCWHARASVVGEIGIDLMSAGKTLDVESAEPIYVRPSEAERKRASRRGPGSGKREGSK